jgi:2-keto-myo-inositol isomerase
LEFGDWDLDHFFKLTGDIGLSTVELRNDLPGGRIIDYPSTKQVRTPANKYQIRILIINAVQEFNLGVVLDDVCSDVQKMINTAGAIGCRAIDPIHGKGLFTL